MKCVSLHLGLLVPAICFLGSILVSAQDVPPRPKFPDVFQVEVQLIFMEKKSEADGIIYYDRTNNRAAVHIVYQNDYTKNFYFFDDDEIVSIQGNECTVDSIGDDPNLSFFPFTIDEETKKKKIASPEDVLKFTDSVYKHEVVSVFPTYIYINTIDVPQYERKDCEVTHMFSKPEMEIPTCEGHACQPTIIAISVQCPGITEDDDPVDHIYDFYRFRSTISDETVFQPPEGVHCPRKSKKAFPQIPPYFSFSYDLIEKATDVDSIGAIIISHKKIWYDGLMKLVRIDEYDDYGVLTTIKIFDYYDGAAYTRLTRSSECSMGPIDDSLALNHITRLPSSIFPDNLPKSKADTVYVGKRKFHGLDYDVWSTISREDELEVIKEIYFTQVIVVADENEDAVKLDKKLGLSESLHMPRILKKEEIESDIRKIYGQYSLDFSNVPNHQDIVSDYELQLSHAQYSSYDKDEDQQYHLMMTTYLPINNYKTDPWDWSVFDVASCFKNEQKKAFEIKVKGPEILQNSARYMRILFELQKKLVNTTEISVIRMSEVNGVFDSNGKLTAFRGLILENPMSLGIGNNNTEPDMKAAYKKLEAEISKGNYNINITDNDTELKFTIYSIKPLQEETRNELTGYSGASLAAASFIMLLLGIMFGAVAFYVFLKRRKSPPESLQLTKS